jgi:hypothetical protein
MKKINLHLISQHRSETNRLLNRIFEHTISKKEMAVRCGFAIKITKTEIKTKTRNRMMKRIEFDLIKKQSFNWKWRNRESELRREFKLTLINSSAPFLDLNFSYFNMNILAILQLIQWYLFCSFMYRSIDRLIDWMESRQTFDKSN